MSVDNSDIASLDSRAKQRLFVKTLEDMCEKYGVSVDEMDNLMAVASYYMVSLNADYYRAGMRKGFLTCKERMGRSDGALS